MCCCRLRPSAGRAAYGVRGVALVSSEELKEVVAVCYARVSTDEQVVGIAEQLRECRAFALSRGATRIIEVHDDGIPGDAVDRPGLNRVLSLARAGGVDLFVAWDVDRLARDVALQLAIDSEFARHGVRTEYVHFDKQDTPEGRLFFVIRGGFAEFERALITRRMQFGKLRVMKEGRLVQNPRVFGYRFVKGEGTLEPDPDQLPLLLRMYEMCGSGMSASGIARALNESGVSGPRGGRWTNTTVSRILRNPVYCTGVLHIHRHDTRGVHKNRYMPLDRRVRRKERPREEWIPVRVPPLVDVVVWNRAQETLDRTRERHAGTPATFYMLSGLLRCGHCGSLLHGKRTVGRRGEYRYHYVCRRREPGVPGEPKCPLPYLRASDLHEAVWSCVRSWLDRPDLMLEEAQRLVAGSGRERLERQRREAAEEMARLSGARQRLVAALARGLVSVDEVEGELEKTRSSLERLGRLVASLDARIKGLEALRGAAEDLAASARRLLVSAGCNEDRVRARVVRALAKEALVTLQDDGTVRVLVRLRLPELVAGAGQCSSSGDVESGFPEGCAAGGGLDCQFGSQSTTLIVE